MSCDVTPEEERYTLWNHMLASAFLLADTHDGIVQLAITPQSLARAHEEAGERILAPEGAAASLSSAVAAVYAARVLGSPLGLRDLKSRDPDDVPYATGFLALTVLAAYRMHTDEDRTAAAFYPRLAEMLGCRLVPTYPEGYDGNDCIALWEELDQWLVRNFARRLARPDMNTPRPYIAFPLAHVPLRQVDIERLPQFFEAHGYEPGMRPSMGRLAFDLVERSGPWPHLTESGQKALQDSGRRDLVVRQVAHELEHWDGERIDAAGIRIASVELWMDIRRRRAELHLLARRPPGFPETLRDGEHVFVASHEGWYEPVPLGRDDGLVLSNGLRVGSGQSRGGFSLQLRSSSAVPLTPSPDYPGFVSDRALRADAHCAVLCMEEVADQVARYLEAVCGQQVRPRQDETLPFGWRLFTGVRPTNESAPPAGLERLAVESDVRLVCEGGLRLGRRWTWLEDAPARVRVVGSRSGLVVKIDSQEAEVNEDGFLPRELLAKSGDYFIEVGNRIRRKVTVLPGTVSPDCQPWPCSRDLRTPVALPEGDWYVVGSEPGEFLSAAIPLGGSLLFAEFRAIWAIRVGAGSGATAIHLHGDDCDGSVNHPDLRHGPEGAPPESRHGQGSKSEESASAAWAETIYRAKVRNATLGCGFGCSSASLRKAWDQLAKRARTWKRQAKRRSSRVRPLSGASPGQGRRGSPVGAGPCEPRGRRKGA